MGSVVGLVDGSGNLVNSYAYHPSGAALGTPTQGVANSMQYAGYYNDTPISLYQVGARYYDPSIQRWTQQDVITQGPGSTESAASQYTYADDNPVNQVDPSGRCSTWYECYFGVEDIAYGSGALLGSVVLAGASGFFAIPTFGISLLVGEPSALGLAWGGWDLVQAGWSEITG